MAAIRSHEVRPPHEHNQQQEPPVQNWTTIALKVATVVAAVGMVCLSILFFPLPFAILGAVGVTVGAVFIYDFLGTGSCGHFLRNCRRGTDVTMAGRGAVVLDARLRHTPVVVVDHTPGASMPGAVRVIPIPSGGCPETSVRAGVGTDAHVVVSDLSPVPHRGIGGRITPVVNGLDLASNVRVARHGGSPPRTASSQGIDVPPSGLGGRVTQRAAVGGGTTPVADLSPPPSRGGGRSVLRSLGSLLRRRV